MQTRVYPTPLPHEATLPDEAKDLLARLRDFPHVSEEEDPNGWFWQIADHLKRSPAQRMSRWATFSGSGRRYRSNRRPGEDHVRFDPVRLLRELTDRQVDFVLVGMGAGYVQGVPYPNCNIDVTARGTENNLKRLERVLDLLEACPLQWDERGPVADPDLPGFRRLMTTVGMVNIVDALPAVGDHDQIMVCADRLTVADDLSIWVASLEDVTRSKEAASELEQRPAYNRTMDKLHVLMCKETLAARTKYADEWNLWTKSSQRSPPTTSTSW